MVRSPCTSEPTHEPVRNAHAIFRLPALLFAATGLLGGIVACGETPLAGGLDGQITIPGGPYAPGQSYLGRNGYVEYIAGDSPLIFSVPHGGALRPAEIPDRTSSACGGNPTTVTDLNTIELALAMAEAQLQAFGTRPHLIVTHLDRDKLDANRSLAAGACGSPAAEIAWTEFHEFIGVARGAVLEAAGRGWYMDVHGHGHAEQRLELGYLLTGGELALSDAGLDGTPGYEETSSIRTMSRDDAETSFAELLRGPTSLGTLYENGGFPAVPSAGDPDPGTGLYFSGGYDTRRHTCSAGSVDLGGEADGRVCGVQLEANYTGVRDEGANRRRFGEATAAALEVYLRVHWGLDLAPAG